MEILSLHLYAEALGILKRKVEGVDIYQLSRHIYENHGKDENILRIFEPIIQASKAIQMIEVDTTAPVFQIVEEEGMLLGEKLFYAYTDFRLCDKPSTYVYQNFQQDHGKALVASLLEQEIEHDPIRTIVKSDLSDTLKLAVIALLSDGHLMITKFCELLELCAEKIREILSKVSIEPYQEACHIDTLQEQLHMQFKEHGELEILPMLMCCNEAVYYDIHRLRVGVLFFAITGLMESPKYTQEQLFEKMKVLADPTKGKILQLLKKESTYQKHLAQLMQLSTPTINHHIQQLVCHQFVKQSFDDKKGYYVVNDTEIHAVLQQYQLYIGLQQQEEIG